MTFTTINFNTKRNASILIDTKALLLGRPVQWLGLSANVSRGSYSPVIGFSCDSFESYRIVLFLKHFLYVFYYFMVISIFMRYRIFGNKTILVFMFQSETILVFWIRLYFKIVQFPANPKAILYSQWHKLIEDWNKTKNIIVKLKDLQHKHFVMNKLSHYK